jgi:predicted dehydrogenase
LRQIGVKNIGVCDPDGAKTREALGQIGPAEAEAFASLTEALRYKWDAAFICTPPSMHIAQLMECVRAGCDVFSEKPLSTSLEGIEELGNMLETCRRLMMVGLCFRYHHGLRQVKQLIASGEIGRLLCIRASVGEDLSIARPGVDYKKLYVTAADTGIVLDMCHEPDFVQWVAGSEAVRAVALHGKLSDLDMRGDDFAEMLLTLEGGAVAEVHLDFFSAVRRRKNEYVGTEGVVELDMADWDRNELNVYTRAAGKWETHVLQMDRDDMFREMDTEFLECTITRRAPPIGLAEGARLLRLLLAVKNRGAYDRSADG